MHSKSRLCHSAKKRGGVGAEADDAAAAAAAAVSYKQPHVELSGFSLNESLPGFLRGCGLLQLEVHPSTIGWIKDVKAEGGCWGLGW